MSLRVGVYCQWPYVTDCVFAQGSLSPKYNNCGDPGVCAELLHVILATMRRPYELVMFDRPPSFGGRNETTGFEQQIANGSIDLVTVFSGTLYRTEAHLQDFNFAWPLLYFKDTFVIRAHTSSPLGAIQQLTRMFSAEVWLACLSIQVIAFVALGISQLYPSAARVKQTSTFLAIIMLPLYGTVLAVQLAVPNEIRHTYAEVAEMVRQGSVQLVFNGDIPDRHKDYATGWATYRGVQFRMDNLLLEHDVIKSLNMVADGGKVLMASKVWSGAGIVESGLTNLRQVETPQILYTATLIVRKNDTKLLRDVNEAILLCFEELRRVKQKYGVALEGEDDKENSQSTQMQPFGMNNFMGVVYLCALFFTVSVVALFVELIVKRNRQL